MLTDIEVFVLRAERLPEALRYLLYPEVGEPKHDESEIHLNDKAAPATSR